MGEDGLKISSPDDAFQATIGGRLQVDSQVNWQQEDNPGNFSTGAYPLSDGANFRRARIFVEGSYYKDWEYRLEYDFVRGSAATGITDAFLKVKMFEPLTLTFGQYKEPISLESVTSNRFLTFIERSLPNNAFVEFANPYMVGFMADGFGDVWGMPFTARASFQTEPVGGGNPNASTPVGGNSNRNGYIGNTGFGPIGRFTFLPWSNGTDVVHVGVNGSYREPNNNYSEANGQFRNGGMSFASQIDSNVDRSALFNTGNLDTPNGSRQVNHFTRFNPELAVVYGPFSVQGEYFRTQISGRGYDSSDVLDGYYGFASFFLTGESRNFDKKRGAFARLTPFQNFDWEEGGGWGAWEIAARWDYLDMNTPHIFGGRGQIGTAALNWYINPRVRFMVDYVHVFTYRQDPKNTMLYAINGLHNDIFETRLQIDW